jgi:hypothetical protein
MKFDTITYCLPYRTPIPKSTEALICVDAALLAVAFSALRTLCCIESSSRVPPKLYEEKGLILHSRNSRGRDNISPASRHRTAHSRRLRYWSNLTMFPSHASPAELVITTTLGTSHGPTQPLMVSWTRFNSPRFRHSLFSHSTGTSGKPRSTLPQQHPRQIVICPITRRFVFSGQSRSSLTKPDPPSV